MAAKKYVQIGSGGAKEEVQASDSSAGAGDAGKIVALDASGKLDNSMMPVGIGADTKSLVTSENLAAGDIVNVWNDTGTAKARKADATAVGKKGVGFVLAAVTSPAAATVYFEGTITGLSGLTIGTEYFLDTTAGLITATPPAATGNVLQSVGIAISATELSFEPGDAFTRA